MRPLLSLHVMLPLGVLFVACVPSVLAATIVLDGDDLSDWARVFSSSTWKQKDACLHPNALLKFDLSRIPATQTILDARLHLFVERVLPGTAIDLWHVVDDSWSYGTSEPADIWNWPTGDLIATQAFQDTMSFSVDVTQHLIEESQAGNRLFSIKIVGHDAWYQPIRIASPMAPLERMRPRIVVTFPDSPVAHLADLAITQADIRLSPMRPVPGQAVTLQARVRNVGAAGAWNVPVAFSDGPPDGGNPPIGIWIIPYLAPGGAAAQTSVAWTCVRGLHDVYVTVDPDNMIPETSETNNTDLRPFLVGEMQDYAVSTESFEYPGRFTYHGDFDVPKQFEYPGPKSFYINGSGGEVYNGHHSMEMYLDGTADDGTIWIETAVPVEPNSYADVQVDFELFRYFADMAFLPVAAVTLFDPEMEGDFTILDSASQDGWSLHSLRRTIFSGPYDMVHIAVGLTCTWETPGTFYIDQIRTRVEEIPLSELDAWQPDVSSETLLFQNQPNPSGPRTTIAYRLAQPGPVFLQMFDSVGRLLTTIASGTQGAGLHRVRWDGTDGEGSALPSGVYFYRLRTAEKEEGRKLLLVR